MGQANTPNIIWRGAFIAMLQHSSSRYLPHGLPSNRTLTHTLSPITLAHATAKHACATMPCHCCAVLRGQGHGEANLVVRTRMSP